MIPILYDKTETAFTSNGIGRLRDCISCIVTEERNGIYELDFQYPVDGANYDLIQVGRIVGVTHDESGDVQPFDIVSFEKPIDGIVTFHCVHISYRQSYLTATGTNVQSLSDAFTLFGNATPTNPFTYWTDKTSTGYLGCADGVPKTVRSMLGGIEGSVLDAYGGEYEWDRWTVKLWSARGSYRDFAIRYGVNMLDYNEEYDSSSVYSSCIPYWTDGTTTIVGDKQTSGGITPSGREQCVPLDVSEKFESQPTKAQVESMGLSVMNSANPTVPTQNITVSFVRLQDMGEFADYQNLLQCKLCDTIKVIFPDFNSSGTFKIVKTVWNVLTSKYDEMELGDLSMSLSEALGINDIQRDSKSTIEQLQSQVDDIDYVLGTSGNWTYKKYNDGTLECWLEVNPGAYTCGTASGNMYSGGYISYTYPVSFNATPAVTVGAALTTDAYVVGAQMSEVSTTGVKVRIVSGSSISANSNYTIHIHAIGKWQ